MYVPRIARVYAVHGVGKVDTEIEAEMTNPESSRQPYDSVDSVGIEVLFKLHAASIKYVSFISYIMCELYLTNHHGMFELNNRWTIVRACARWIVRRAERCALDRATSRALRLGTNSEDRAARDRDSAATASGRWSLPNPDGHSGRGDCAGRDELRRVVSQDGGLALRHDASDLDRGHHDASDLNRGCHNASDLDHTADPSNKTRGSATMIGLCFR